MFHFTISGRGQNSGSIGNPTFPVKFCCKGPNPGFFNFTMKLVQTRTSELAIPLRSPSKSLFSISFKHFGKRKHRKIAGRAYTTNNNSPSWICIGTHVFGDLGHGIKVHQVFQDFRDRRTRTFLLITEVAEMSFSSLHVLLRIFLYLSS